VTFYFRRAARVLALTTVAGCHAYHPARAPTPPGSVVRVRFDPPRTLTVARRRSPGDSVRVYFVTGVDGRVRAARGDTLELELRSVRPGAPAATLGGRTHVVPPYRQPVEVMGADVARTVAVVVVVALGLAALIAAWASAMASAVY
jgi:hypothetical protein